MPSGKELVYEGPGFGLYNPDRFIRHMANSRLKEIELERKSSVNFSEISGVFEWHGQKVLYHATKKANDGTISSLFNVKVEVEGENRGDLAKWILISEKSF